jgi:hypothetical protein
LDESGGVDVLKVFSRRVADRRGDSDRNDQAKVAPSRKNDWSRE